MTAVTSGRWTEGGHWWQIDPPLSKCPVFLNLLLFLSLILFSPALWAQASPSLVAIKTTSFGAEQLWLVHMDRSPLIYHLYRVEEIVCWRREESGQNLIKTSRYVYNYAVSILAHLKCMEETDWLYCWLNYRSAIDNYQLLTSEYKKNTTQACPFKL